MNCLCMDGAPAHERIVTDQRIVFDRAVTCPKGDYGLDCKSHGTVQSSTCAGNVEGVLDSQLVFALACRNTPQLLQLGAKCL
jgi:hypothetical protein